MSTEFRLYGIAKEDLYENKTKEEKEKIIPEMVKYAMEHGNKPAARYFNTYPATVRRWVKRYKEKGKEGLKLK